MIVSKPKVSSLISLGIFLLAAYSVSLVLLLQILNIPNLPWYFPVLFGIVLTVALFVTYKVVTAFKIIRIGKQKMEVHFPLKGKKRQFNLSNLDAWKETIIKTGAGTYKELELHFTTGPSIKMTLQENTNYDKVYQYLNKKYSKKRT
jgi:hypothetical protein